MTGRRRGTCPTCGQTDVGLTLDGNVFEAHERGARHKAAIAERDRQSVARDLERSINALEQSGFVITLPSDPESP